MKEQSFSFTQFVGLNIRTPFNIEIPVPQGEEEKARKINLYERSLIIT